MIVRYGERTVHQLGGFDFEVVRLSFDESMSQEVLKLKKERAVRIPL